MSPFWEKGFEQRFEPHESDGLRPNNAARLSLKIRIKSGCFHPLHSPRAFVMMRKALNSPDVKDFHVQFEEHESGPEYLFWIPVATAGILLATALINLTTAIINAKVAGEKNGDPQQMPFDIVVRGFDTNGQYREITLADIEQSKDLKKQEFDKKISVFIDEWIKEDKGMKVKKKRNQ